MAIIPEHMRPALRAALDELTAGERPELLVWVHEYGPNGAVLIHQPEGIWSHRESWTTPGPDGSLAVILPLWTTDESPSDLSAECTVTADGRVVIDNVHVL